MRAFIKSVAMGTIAGAWLPSAVLLLLLVWAPEDGEERGGVLSGVVMAGSPLALAFVFVLPACLVIGLPLTAVLARLRAESSAVYVSIGFVAGFGLVQTALWWIDLADLWPLAFFGAFSGSVTARTWWVEARSIVP